MIEGKFKVMEIPADAKVPFKMQKFKEVPAKISVQRLENTQADLVRTEAMKSRSSLDTKHYIK